MEVFYCLLLLSCFQSLVQTELLGKFIFHGQNDAKHDSPSLSILHKPDSVNFAPSPGAILSDEVSSILSLSLGLSINKDLKWPGLQAGNLFNRPKAVMMFTVDGVPRGDAFKMKSAESFPVTMSDDASTVADIYHVSPLSSLPNHVNAIFGGKSTTLSVSSDQRVAIGGYSVADSSKVAFWDGQIDAWKVVTGGEESKESLSRHGVLKRIFKVLPKGFTYNEEEKRVVVNVKGLEVSFNLENEVDFGFFSELVYMFWQYEQIEMAKAGYKDETPDVYLFAVSSLKNLEEKYGAGSKQVRAALMVLEKFVPTMVDNFLKLYGGNILAVGLTISSTVSAMREENVNLRNVVNSLKEKVGENVHSVDGLIPELHVLSDMESAARKKLCEQVQRSIFNHASVLKFKCASEPEVVRARRSLLGKNDNDADINLASVYDESFPVIFNIWFWLLVLLVLSVYVVSLTMWYMDPGRDSIIYRLTQQKIKAE